MVGVVEVVGVVEDSSFSLQLTVPIIIKNNTYTSTDLTYTTSDLTTNTTYYWKVIASDTKGGSAESETWSFTVQ